MQLHAFVSLNELSPVLCISVGELASVMAEHAVAAFRALSGVFCIYKPAGRSMTQVVGAIKTNLVKGNEIS